MSDTQDEGRRLYKARRPDGEVAWVDHDELWRLQQGQAERLRRDRVRRRRLVLLALVGLVGLVLVLGIFHLRSSSTPPPTVAAGSRPVPPSGAGLPVVEETDVEPLALAAVGAAEVAGAVRAWAAAWAAQDVRAYLGSYAADFRPADRSRSSWQRLRRRRLLEPASIQVEVEALEIVVQEDHRAEARFIQHYSSPDYSDVVRKTLDLVEEEGSWRIVAERVEAP